MKKSQKTVLIAAGWVASATALLTLLGMLDIRWNLFSWGTVWNIEVYALLAGIITLLAGMAFLSKVTSEKISLVLAVLACAVMVGAAIYWLPSEPLTEGFLGRHASSPDWYRFGRVILVALPLAFLYVSRPRREN